MENKKRSRSKNYTDEEVLLLVDLVEGYSDIVENKQTCKISNDKKVKAWKEIAKQFNCLASASDRSDELLRQKFESLKRDTRKHYVNQSIVSKETGQELQINQIYERIKDVMKISVESLVAKYDSNPSGNSKNCQHCSETLNDSSSEMLQEPVSSIVTLKFEPEDAEIILDISEGESRIPNLRVGLKDQGTQVDATSVLSAPWYLPNLKKKAKSISMRTSDKFKYWAGPKRKLVKLQMQLMKKKFMNDERREEELFKKKMEILEIKKNANYRIYSIDI